MFQVHFERLPILITKHLQGRSFMPLFPLPPADPKTLDLRLLEKDKLLGIRSPHTRVTPGHFNPLALEPIQLARDRWKVQMVVDQFTSCQNLNSKHSALPRLAPRAQTLFNQAVGQELLRHYKLPYRHSPVEYLTPVGTIRSDQLLDEHGQAANPPLPQEVLDRLKRFTNPQPWLLEHALSFDTRYPRAKGLVHLYFLVLDSSTGSRSKVLFASDRNAGRLYHIMRHASQDYPYLFMVGPNCHIVQYMLSNTLLT
jgi:hypothetical protein